jgi:hypothetical protein
MNCVGVGYTILVRAGPTEIGLVVQRAVRRRTIDARKSRSGVLSRLGELETRADLRDRRILIDQLQHCGIDTSTDSCVWLISSRSSARIAARGIVPPLWNRFKPGNNTGTGSP